MKRNCFLIGLITVLCLTFISDSLAFDAITKINLRNSYSAFENCMVSSQNDITECIETFETAVDVHRKALKLEPENEDVKHNLLVILNSMNDIAQTYFDAATKKQGSQPIMARKYFLKAAICYDQLSKIYTKNDEFHQKKIEANYLAEQEDVIGYIKDLQSKKSINDIIYSLSNLKNSRDRFLSKYKPNENIDSKISSALSAVFMKVKTDSNKIMLPDQMPQFLSYINLQNVIVEFDPTNAHKNLLVDMQNRVIDSALQSVTRLNNLSNLAENSIAKQDFRNAKRLCEDALSISNQYPDTSKASPDLAKRIKNETKQFNLIRFQKDIKNKLTLAETSLQFTGFINAGKTALNQKQYYDAYLKFIDADNFSKSNKVVADPGTAKKYINETLVIISNLEPSEIEDINIARLYYKHLTFSKWLKEAEKGVFSHDPVYITGVVQQEVGGIVILLKDSFQYNFLTDSIYSQQTLNNVGVIFNGDRLMRSGNSVECIGTYKMLQSFETILGSEVKIPIFKVIWPK